MIYNLGKKRRLSLALFWVSLGLLTGCSTGPFYAGPVLKREVLRSQPAAKMYPMPAQAPVTAGENYAPPAENPIEQVLKNPVSTFGADVDSASYSNVRRLLQAGLKPPKGAVRVEEFMNYFDYEWQKPSSGTRPFHVSLEVAPTPWNSHTHLMAVGMKAFQVPQDQRPPAHLVFLVDVSGSMQAENKLPLVIKSLKLLLGSLEAKDRISLVTYAGTSKTLLKAVPGDDKAAIRSALSSLNASGGTNGGAGIETAYDLAETHKMANGINRVILATDGDLNVGLTDFDQLIELIEAKREKGVTLTTIGVGDGNYNDHLMEQLADHGNGNHAYIDSFAEAHKVFSQELVGTLLTVAKDLKIQVEFNPATVAEYRLIGYENRLLATEDFRNDKVDSGDIGAGHSVTALYELAFVGSEGQMFPSLRYQASHNAAGGDHAQSQKAGAHKDELALVRLRYKHPKTDQAEELSFPVQKKETKATFTAASEDFRFAASVAAFGQKLKGGTFTKDLTWKDIEDLARQSRGEDPHGDRAGLLGLIPLAMALEDEGQR